MKRGKGDARSTESSGGRQRRQSQLRFAFLFGCPERCGAVQRDAVSRCSLFRTPPAPPTRTTTQSDTVFGSDVNLSPTRLVKFAPSTRPRPASRCSSNSSSPFPPSPVIGGVEWPRQHQTPPLIPRSSTCHTTRRCPVADGGTLARTVGVADFASLWLRCRQTMSWHGASLNLTSFAA